MTPSDDIHSPLLGFCEGLGDGTIERLREASKKSAAQVFAIFNRALNEKGLCIQISQKRGEDDLGVQAEHGKGIQPAERMIGHKSGPFNPRRECAARSR